MSTLLNRLKTERTAAYEQAITPVTLESETHTGGCMRVKPQYNVYAKSIDRLIHSHGDHYLLISYEDILSGLSNSLDHYGIDLKGASIQFDVSNTLSRMRLRVMFGDESEFGSHTMQYNTDDKLQFGIEVTSSYDASIVFKLQAMFLRLICDNGMKSTESFNSSIKRHTLNFKVEDAFDKLKGLNTSFKKLSDRFETYQSVKLTQADVNKLFKKFSKGSEGKEYLLKNVFEDKKIVTLWDVYNALTNYSSHNKQAVHIGKRNAKVKEYAIKDARMDKIRSDDKRTAEVQNFIESNTFLFFVHQGVSNQLQSN
jgi:hypothetical protein